MIQTSVEYFALSVSDIDMATHFYAQAFSMSEVEAAVDMPSLGIRTRIIATPTGLRAELIERAGSTPQTPQDVVTRSSTQGFTHVALRVTDLERAVADVANAGGVVHSQPRDAQRPHTRFAYVADPDGNLIELVSAV